MNIAQPMIPPNSTQKLGTFITPFKFFVAGSVAASVNFFGRIFISHYFNYPTAIVLAYCLGIVTAFALNRRYVFQHSTNPLHLQIVWFVSINVLALAQTLAASLLLDEILFPRIGIVWHPQELAHAMGIAIPVFTSYLGHKHWTFR